jgi:hypothetical protein
MLIPARQVRYPDFNLRRAPKITKLFSQDRILRGAPDGDLF